MTESSSETPSAWLELAQRSVSHAAGDDDVISVTRNVEYADSSGPFTGCSSSVIKRRRASRHHKLPTLTRVPGRLHTTVRHNNCSHLGPRQASVSTSPSHVLGRLTSQYKRQLSSPSSTTAAEETTTSLCAPVAYSYSTTPAADAPSSRTRHTLSSFFCFGPQLPG